jgi:phosphoglycolate phosphatase
MDLDGTLADSLDLMHRVYHKFLEGFGREGSAREFDLLNGPPLREGVALLMKNHDLPGTEDELFLRYVGLATGGYAKYSKPAPGAHRLLHLARVRGFETALVTSAPLDLAEEFLENHQLADLIDVTVGAETVTHGKPAPDPYREALHRLGLPAKFGLAVEDTVTGVTSAAAAGLTVWALGQPGEKDALLAAGAASVVRDLLQVAEDLENV